MTKISGHFFLWLAGTGIFIVLFVLVEVVLRFMDLKPGVVSEFYYHRGSLEYDAVLYADENGITHLVQGRFKSPGQRVNNEGFLSDLEYTAAAVDSVRAAGKKIVMLVGDSYAAGCCADTYSNSFAGHLSREPGYELLNFGMPGTDPLQYRLVIEKYLSIVRPDLVIVAVYLGNDLMYYDRRPRPYVPVCYPVKNGPWLNSEPPLHLAPAETFFSNFDEAKSFYFRYYSLRSESSTMFEKTIRNSILLTRIYLPLKTKLATHRLRGQLFYPPQNPPYTSQNLDKIAAICAMAKTKLLFVAVPPPLDAHHRIDLQKKYSFFFDGLPWVTASSLTLHDYNGKGIESHFNNAGHSKFAAFLAPLIREKLLE